MTSDEYRAAVEPYAAALQIVREAIEELFGPVAGLESDEVVLHHGPEPIHRAEAIVAFLRRVATQANFERPASVTWLPALEAERRPLMERRSSESEAERKKRIETQEANLALDKTFKKGDKDPLPVTATKPGGSPQNPD